MITQSEKERQEVVGSTQGSEPARDNTPVASNPVSEIHTNIDGPVDSDRHLENEQASVNQLEKTMKQNKHTSLADVPAQEQPEPTAAAGAVQEVDWGDPELMSEGKLERIRPDKNSGRSIRLAFLPFLPPRKAKVHWVKSATGMSCRLCLAKGNTPGYCCRKLKEEPEFRAVALAIQYTNTDSKGGYPKGYTGPIEWQVAYVELSRSNFRSVSALVEEGASVTDYDIAMSMDARRYQFKVKSRKARWKLDPTLAKAVEEAARPFVVDGGARLGQKLGKPTNLVEWKALLSGATATEPSLDDFEDP